MDTALFKTAFSAKAIFIPADRADTTPCEATPQATAFTAALVKIGYTVDERLFHALCHISNEEIAEINLMIENILGLHLNWMPMIRNWQTPVGVDFYDSLIAMFANVLPSLKDIPGTTLPCGHFIPEGTFPLERYNGCPLCGRTFAVADYTFTGQGTKLKTLSLWTETDLLGYERSLLESKTPLEGAQTEALKVLLEHFGLPDEIDIKIRETAAIVFLYLAGKNACDRAAAFVKSPADILRALWFEKTGCARIVRPKDIAAREAGNTGYRWQPDYNERKEKKRSETAEALKLKYGRSMCRFVATLFEQMQMSAQDKCENMHPHRGMWVRFIRALRLTEYARKKEFPKLREVLDRFYRGDYPVWAGKVETAILSKDTIPALRLLSERPGAFARRLFSSMLHLGASSVVDAFIDAGEHIDIRLLLTLDMYADYCLDPDNERSVRLPGGATHIIPPSKYLKGTPPKEISAMTAAVKDACKTLISRHFASRGEIGGTVYIQKELFEIPVPEQFRGILPSAGLAHTRRRRQHTPVHALGRRPAGATPRHGFKRHNNLPRPHRQLRLLRPKPPWRHSQRRHTADTRQCRSCRIYRTRHSRSLCSRSHPCGFYCKRIYRRRSKPYGESGLDGFMLPHESRQ